MSTPNNLQWKLFQPPNSNQDLIDIQPSNVHAKPAHRNGGFSSDYPSSPRDSRGSVGGSGYTGYAADSDNMMGDSLQSYPLAASNSSQNYDSQNHPPIRETGIIEKLLHSYGFIQCCERQARLFFHFSQFSGTIEHLRVGDPVEFEMTYDRRTGKPIASTVTKIAPEVGTATVLKMLALCRAIHVEGDDIAHYTTVLSEARVTGTVTTELKGEGSGDTTGRISYENRGECFFLPYTKDDVEGNVTLKSGDAVSFQIATNQRGSLGACHVRFENPAHPVKYHGVVCSMKESFGFIERADVVKEIFFHFSEAKIKEELTPGDDVEFIIQTRNGKEVACNLTKLPSGSVVFEDVGPQMLRGQVLKSLERGSLARAHQSDALPGRIRYRAPDHSEVEVPFGDKDQCAEFTLRHGDWVEFQVATDRRDRLRRATNISLLDDSFTVSGERRERGVVCSLKEGFGFIRSVDRDLKLFFHFAEVLRLGQELSVGDEVEYTMDPVSSFSNTKSRQSAIRIKHLPPGTLMPRSVVAAPAPAPAAAPSANNGKDHHTSAAASAAGTTASSHYLQEPKESNSFQNYGSKLTITRFIKDESKSHRDDDSSMFQNYQGSHSNGGTSNGGGSSRHQVQQGFIAALKDGFGFIETKDLSKEVFFHFSNFDGSPDALVLGREVEYTLGRVGGANNCSSADLVRLLPRGSVPVPRPLEPTLSGSVTRTLRALNPDQLHYSGQVQATNGGQLHDFGIMGLACKREILQVGDQVTFQADMEGRATNIVPIRKKGRAIVDAIKGGFGFLTVDNEDGKRLFFHMSEVRGNASELQPGDSVEFVLMTNPRNGKSSACNVIKISGKTAKVPRERPERLINRLRSTSLEDASAPRVVATRHPRGPDGTRGFRPRQPISDLLRESSKE